MPQITQLADVFASQLFWLAVIFGVIFFGVGKGMLPKISSTKHARDATITKDLDAARAARESAEKQEAQWRERIDAARQHAAHIAQEATKASARENEARVQAALGDLDAQVERGRLRIRAAVDAARSELETAAVEAAQQIVEQLTGLKVNRDDAAAAVAAELGGWSRSKGRDEVAPSDTRRAVSGRR